MCSYFVAEGSQAGCSSHNLSCVQQEQTRCFQDLAPIWFSSQALSEGAWHLVCFLGGFICWYTSTA